MRNEQANAGGIRCPLEAIQIAAEIAWPHIQTANRGSETKAPATKTAVHVDADDGARQRNKPRVFPRYWGGDFPQFLGTPAIGTDASKSFTKKNQCVIEFNILGTGNALDSEHENEY
jgi:hypothetical protein